MGSEFLEKKIDNFQGINGEYFFCDFVSYINKVDFNFDIFIEVRCGSYLFEIIYIENNRTRVYLF